MAELEVEVAHHGGVAVVKPVGWITNQNAESLEERLKRLIDEGDRRIVLDLSAAQFISSTVLGVFIYYQKTLTEGGGCFVIACPSSSVLRILFAARLAKVLQHSDTVAEAVELANRWSGSGSGRQRAVAPVG